MQPLVITEKHIEHVRNRVATYDDLAKRYRSDSDFKSRIDGGDVTDALSELGLDLPPGTEARIVANTSDTVHVVLPPDPNASLSDEALSMVAGGKSASSAGSAGTVGTIGTLTTTAGTISTAGSAASAGSAS